MAPAHRPQAGITLIEILVVVFIIGVMAGAAVLSTSVTGSDQDLKHEALRIKSVLELLQEEALMQGRDYGIQITDTGYEFLVFDYDQFAWVDTDDQEILKPYQLDEKLSMELNLDGREVILQPPEEGIEDPKPQIMLMSGGEITPFEMRFYRELTGGRFIVTGEITGKLEVTSRGFD
jgi:general secretion pathway protein H